jgi:hypothetical protein
MSEAEINAANNPRIPRTKDKCPNPKCNLLIPVYVKNRVLYKCKCGWTGSIKRDAR